MFAFRIRGADSFWWSGMVAMGKKAVKRTAKATGAEPRKRGRPSLAHSAQITADILAHATTMFLTLGYEATSMEALANHLGIPKTTLYKRYSDKADLLRAVIDERVEQWSSLNAFREPSPSRELDEQLNVYATTLLRWATHPEVRAITRLSANLPGSPDTGFAGPNLGGYRTIHGLIEDVVRELGPAQGISAKNPARAADMLMAIVAGTVAMRTDPDQLGELEATGLAADIVDHLIRGAQAW
ncbi:TetR/AcrR family transcriptional regulator (plasmid) [Novosphingobium sp. BL-8A]|uniref:TetR/AcrR family transcriptional regulator n=1 Tax=Novosphingobium sp. BL-8A TaxID=3127639 RepID=UPI00375690B2